MVALSAVAGAEGRFWASVDKTPTGWRVKARLSNPSRSDDYRANLTTYCGARRRVLRRLGVSRLADADPELAARLMREERFPGDDCQPADPERTAA